MPTRLTTSCRTLLALLVVALSCVACADSERDLLFDKVIATGDARIEVGITNDKRLATRVQVLEALTTAAHTANSEGRVHFDDRAPEAAIRRGITSTARKVTRALYPPGTKDHHGCSGDRENH